MATERCPCGTHDCLPRLATSPVVLDPEWPKEVTRVFSDLGGDRVSFLDLAKRAEAELRQSRLMMRSAASPCYRSVVRAFVVSHPRLQSALYDLDTAPEDTIDTPAWFRTVRIVALYADAAGIAPPWSRAAAPMTIRDRDPNANETAARAFMRATERASAGSPTSTSAPPVMPEPVAQVPRSLDARTLAACAAQAERIECEALGSPIAQDTARRIRLAILALDDRGAGSETVEEAR